MTATIPPRIGTRYRGAVYGLDVLDHDSVMAGTPRIVPNDYVGKTRQRGRARELQHRDRQPFANLIVGDAHVLWEGMCTDDELAEMERRFIQDPPSGVRPRLNVEMNEGNQARIPKWKQIEQRHQRDDAAGRPRWVPFEQRNRASLLEWDTAPPSVRRPGSAVQAPRWGNALGVLISWPSLWCLLFLVQFIAVMHWHVGHLGWRQAGVGSAVLSAAAISWARAGFPLPKRKKRRRGRGRR